MLIAAPSERPLAAEKRCVLTLNSSTASQGSCMTGPPTVLSLLSTPFTVTLTLATALSVDGEDRVAILGRIVGIGKLDARSERSQVSNIAADHRQFLHFGRSNGLADLGFGNVH